MNKCLDCQFYDRKNVRSTDGRATMWGQCRRHSPLLNPQNAKTYQVDGVWPVVRDDDWCGEWIAPAAMPLPRTHGIINGKELMAAAVSASESNGGPHAAQESRPFLVAAGDD